VAAFTTFIGSRVFVHPSQRLIGHLLSGTSKIVDIDSTTVRSV